ncbi:MAG: right-handed parallel beta-helix repeat-containing protein [Kiritimatiellales bacterium]|nr:right-handed parallel beta-helix repeat-containing protein [Kiritimatiellales bacterium]
MKLTLTPFITLLVSLSAAAEQPWGGTFPWVRYEAENADRTSKTTLHANDIYGLEAAGQRAVELTAGGSFVEWTMQADGDGIVFRYSVPDVPDGEPRVDFLVNDEERGVIALTPRFSHLYDSQFEASKNRADGNHRRVYDETRLRHPLKKGDRFVVRLPESFTKSAEPVCIDFIEVERIAAEIPPPAQALVVTDFGAVAGDGKDDLAAFDACFKSARQSGKTAYLPRGVFHLSNRIALPPRIRVQGAGIWHTELRFTSAESGKTRGFTTADATERIEMRDFFFAGQGGMIHDGGQPFNGPMGKDSVLENLWWEHLYNARFVRNENLTVRHCRVRNVFAGGLILFEGSIAAVVENNHVRQAGDDGIATCASHHGAGENAPINTNNTIRRNTVELTARAAGIGIFGGNSTRVYHNRVLDTLPSAQADIRFTSSFESHPFGAGSENQHRVYENEFSGCRAHMGSILFGTRYTPVENIVLRDCKISRLGAPLLYFRAQKPHVCKGLQIEHVSVEVSADAPDTLPGLVVETKFQGEVSLERVVVKDRTLKVENASQSMQIRLGSGVQGLTSNRKP